MTEVTIEVELKDKLGQEVAIEVSCELEPASAGGRHEPPSGPCAYFDESDIENKLGRKLSKSESEEIAQAAFNAADNVDASMDAGDQKYHEKVEEGLIGR